MSLSSEIRANNKKKNSNNIKQIIKNQKFMNAVRLVLFLTLLIADIFYIIKENIIGISNFTNTLLIIAIVLEGLIFFGLLFLRFNTEIKLLKIISTAIYAIPIIAYIPMMAYGDSFSIILFIIRIILIGGLLFIATRETQSIQGSRFVLKQVGYILMVAVIFIVTFVLLITSSTRRVVYAYDETKEGYVVKNVLKGYSKVEFKDGTVKISDNSLENAGEVITIPSSVVEVSEKAFEGSNVKEIYLNSYNVSIIAALRNSNVEKVYINEPTLVINDLSLASKRNKFKFYLNKEVVDEYREKNRKYDYLFVPVCDDGEYYVAYNNTSLPIEYYKSGENVKSPTVTSTNVKRFKEWEYTFSQESGSINPKFPINITNSLDLSAKWNTVYKISLNYHGGEIVSSSSNIFDNLPNEIYVVYDDGDIILPTLAKSGFRFDGWSVYGSDEIIANNIIRKEEIYNLDLEAKFSISYKLDYELNGGRFDNEDEASQEYYDGDEITPATPVRDGYTFAGWYIDPEFNSQRVEIVNVAGTKLYAKWNINTYNIDYELNGGIHENKKYTSTVEDNYVFSDAEKTGYDFLGWYSDPEFTNEIKDTSDILSDVTLYAKFEANKYVINYNLNGGEASIDSMDVVFDTAYDLITPSKVGYKFICWNYDNQEIESGIYKFDHDIEIKAIYELLAPTIELTEDINKVYDNTSSTIGVSVSHPLSNDPKFNVTTTWHIVGNDEFKRNQHSFNVKDSQNNEYYCHIVINYLEESYELDTDIISVNIEKRDYDLSNIDFEAFEFEFNGKKQIPIIENLPTGLDGIDLFATYSYSGAFTEVGDYGIVTAKFYTNSNNYNVPADMTASVSIVLRKLTISYDSLEHVYDGNSWLPTLSLVGLIDGYDASISIEGSAPINVGNYTRNVSISEETHYTIEAEEISFAIIPADYDLSNITYDALTFEYNGNYQYPNPTNLPSGLEVDNTTIGLKNVCDNEDVYIKLKNSNSNYNNPSDLVISITITPLKLDANLAKTSYVYDGNTKEIELVLIGVVPGDQVSGLILNEDVNFGTYKINAELIGSDKDNYVLSNDVYNLSYVITKADYDLTNITYDTKTFEYNGNYQYPNPTNLPSGLEVDNTTIGLKNVCDNEDVYIKLKNNNSNYNNPSDLVVSITITPLKIKADVANNSFVYNNKLSVPTITLSGYIDGDIVTAKALNTDSINVGTYEVVVGLEGIDKDNYVVDTENSNLGYEITKAEFNTQYIFYSTTTYTYDGNEHAPELDLEHSDRKYYTDYNHLINYEALETKSDAGTYDISVRFYVDNNYKEYTKTYNIQISKKIITLEFDSLSFTYNDGNLFTPVVTNYNGLIDGDDLEIVVTNSNIKTPGTYPLTFEFNGSDANNYDVLATYVATVYGVQKEISGFTVNDYEGFYDGLAHTVTVDGLDTDITPVFDKTFKDVGEYTVNITFKSKDANEGISTTATGKVIIKAKPITLEFSDDELIYNGEIQRPKCTINGVISGDSVNIVIANESKDAGTYTATVELDNSNYYISNSTSLTYSISPCHVTLAWGSTNLIYSKTALKPTATVKYNGNVLDTEVLVTTLTNNINVGTYTAEANVTDTNYIIDGVNTTEYKIIAKGLSLKWSNTSLTYDGDAKLPDATVTPITGDNCNVIVSCDVDHFNPGTYQAIAKLDNSNYVIEGNNYTSFIINKGTITRINDVNDLTEVTYDGNTKYPYVDDTSKYTSDGSLVLHRFGSNYVNAGSYYVDVIFYTENGNYDEVIKSVALVINKLELTVTLSENTFKFTNSVLVPEVTPTNLVEGDDVTVTVNNKSVELGEYVAEFKLGGTSSENYKITGVYKYTIVKGILDMSAVTFDNTTVTYNGNSQLPTSSNLPNGVAIDTNNSIGVINVSDTVATIKYVLSGTTLNNYELPNDINVNMTVKTKTITVNWINTVFGYDGNSHRPTYEIVGLVDGDIADLIFSSVDGINRGTYVATVSSIDNPNYYVEEVSTEYEINYGTYDMSGISLQNKTYTYDGKSHNQFSYDGQLPDGVSVSYDYNGANIVNVGTYLVTLVFTGDSENYNPIPNMEANIIINPASIEISWSDTSLTYNGTIQAPKATILGTLYSGDVCNVSVTGGQKNVGTYQATAMLSNSNYVASEETVEFTISPYTINVTVRSGSTTGPNFTYYYDGKVRNNIIATYNDDDLFQDDELIITTNTSNIKAAVGTYSYTLVFDNSNYKTTNITGTVTINKTSISAYNINWNQANTTELPKASYTINGASVALEDMPEITYVYLTYTNEWNASSYTVLDGEPTEAGKYAVTIFSGNEDNITISDYNNIWSFNRFTYAPVQVKEIWSNDGQYNSNLITPTGNSSSTKAKFNIDGEEVTFNSGLKLTSTGGKITFTITKDMTMTIYLNNSTSNADIKINGVNNSVTTGTGNVIQLTAGTYEITKGSHGESIVYAIVLE